MMLDSENEDGILQYTGYQKVAGEENDNTRKYNTRKSPRRMQMQRNKTRLPGTDAGYAVRTAQMDDGVAATS